MASSSIGSSRASASSGQGGGGYDGQGSPVPYRIPPLGYEPPVMCYCNLKACRWISWSNGQPGRRYFRCRHGRVSAYCSCKFFCKSDWNKSFVMNLLKFADE